MKYPNRLKEFRALAGKLGLQFRIIGNVRYSGRKYPLIRLDWKPLGWKCKICIAGVVHGDEVSGVWGIKEYLAHSQLPDDAWIVFFPIVNPYGYENFSRNNHEGKNLNREWFSRRPPKEIALIKKSIANEKFDVFLSIHENEWRENEDFYIYYYGTASKGFLMKIIKAMKKSKLVKIDKRNSIDGHYARNGLVVASRDNSFEYWMFKNKKARVSIVPEMPSKVKFGKRVKGVKRLIEVVG